MCYIMTGTSNQMLVQSIFASGFESCVKFVLGQNKSLQIMIASKLRKWICIDHLIVNMEMSGWGKHEYYRDFGLPFTGTSWVENLLFCA